MGIILKNRAKKKKNEAEKGFSVIEVLIASAIVVIAFSSILGLISFLLGTARINHDSFRAQNLIRSTAEEIRSFRDNTEWDVDGVGSLALGTDYYPEMISGEWTLVSGREEKQDMTRWVVFYEVNRNSDGDIVLSGGSVDPDTLKAVVTVEAPDDNLFTTSFYVSNWR